MRAPAALAILAASAASAAGAVALAPVAARGLEPRYDHRELRGVLVEPLLAHDTVAISGHTTRSSWRPSLRLAYGWDALGEGNELFVGAQAALSSWSDRDRERIHLALDARYRSYFGTEQWKTFFEVGLWAPVASRLAVGPLVSIGVAYDLSRFTGVYADAGFSTGFGQARIATLTASAGAHYRY